MKKNLKGRVVLIVVVLLFFLYGIFGIPKGVSGNAIVQALTNRIQLGLDLQGGAHLILQVQVKEAVNAETDNTVARLQQDLKKANVTFSRVYKPDPLKTDQTGRPEVVTIEGTPATGANAVRSVLDQKYSNDYDVTGGTTGTFTLTMKPTVVTDLEQRTVTQAIEAIRDRVDALGVSEPVIQEYNLGQNQVLVELPGISDLDKVKSIISTTARLEIHPVATPNGGPFPSEQAAQQAFNGAIPPEYEVLPFSGTIGNQNGGDQFYVVQRMAVVAGSDFRSADPATNPDTGQREVQFTLTNAAGEKFYDYTVANIKSPIHDRGEIEGTFSEDEVTTLSKLLRTGSLPASLTYLEDRTVGASLGADSVHEGVTAAIAGILLVLAFMLVYYRGAGINADLALILNLVILLGFMGWVGA